MASWYRPPGSTSEEFHLFREQLDYIRTHHKGKKLPSVHFLGDFNFKDIDWPDSLSKSGSTLNQSEGQILIDSMNDHVLEQMVHFPTREKNALDLNKAPQYFYTDRSKAILLFWFLAATCSCYPYLYFGLAIMLVTYFVNFR